MNIVKESKSIQTIFGSCNINHYGYYQITSRKEKNKGKFLHRLIMKPLLDYMNYKYPELKFDIHHKDGNKLNNNFNNLQIIEKRKHLSLHKKSEKTRQKISDAQRCRGLFGFTGVNLKYKKYWQSQIKYKGNTIYLGTFPDMLSCEIVHDLVSREIIKEELL